LAITTVVDIRMGVTYTLFMEQTPTETPISAGVSNRTAEAERILNSIIGLTAVNLKETHGDLPQLPDRVQA
jgi:hypothetical protein